MKKKIYFLLKLNRKIKNIHIKNLAIFLLHFFKKRYIGVFLDPVLGCNLRCRMCYFSDEEKRKSLKGTFSEEELTAIGNAFFHRALKVQIGCGAEPSLSPYNKKIIEIAKLKGVPYVSITTNGNLFSEEKWWELVQAGLDEVTLSVHGTTKETYEYFMEGASFPVFCNALKTLTQIKRQYIHLKIRINYTINQDNIEELADFFTVFGSYAFDIIQLRPIQPIGDSAYSNFSWDAIYNKYDRVIQYIKEESAKRKIVCITPNKADLIKEGKGENMVMESTYCYISPKSVWRKGFNLKTDHFESYARRTHLGWELLKNVFYSKKHFQNNKKHLNYEIA